MRILSAINYNHTQKLNEKTLGVPFPYSSSKLRALSRDTVSFKRVPNDIQLYRCIGQEEFNKLINGEFVLSSGYMTSDPKGWKAYNWNTGFKDFQSGQNYFITFKRNRFKFVSDARDSEYDTRYVTHSKYSIDDIDNIRLGCNVHGELVYAENIEKAKENDIKQKISEINRLINALSKTKNSTERANIWDELISYVPEFPEIIERVKKFVDFDSQEDVYGYSTIITTINSEEYITEYRKCLKSYTQRGIIPSSDFSYLIEHAEAEDLDDIMTLIEQNHIYHQPAAIILDKIATEDFIIDSLLKDNIKKLDILCYYLKNKKNNGQYNNLYKIILQKAQDISICKFDYMGNIERNNIIQACKA